MEIIVALLAFYVMKMSEKLLFLRITFPFLDDFTLSMDGINDF